MPTTANAVVVLVDSAEDRQDLVSSRSVSAGLGVCPKLGFKGSCPQQPAAVEGWSASRGLFNRMQMPLQDTDVAFGGLRGWLLCDLGGDCALHWQDWSLHRGDSTRRLALSRSPWELHSSPAKPVRSGCLSGFSASLLVSTRDAFGGFQRPSWRLVPPVGLLVIAG
jgi:hypothetical protein